MLSHLIENQWLEGEGREFSSQDPATGQRVWTGREATPAEVERAVAAARRAFESWAATPLEQRMELCRALARCFQAREAELAETISRETGKPLWESRSEVATMVGKIELSIQALERRRGDQVQEIAGAAAATRFKPYGVLAVLGPFNLPGHLPNGHIVPALLAGNTVVFKPSERTPGVGALYAQCWLEARLSPGVFNLVQGARDTGVALSRHPDIDGLLFTGSFAGGLALHHAMVDHPEKILALEMGGNGPLVVHQVADLDAAALMTIQSAYITAGQRCTCARRLIVPQGDEGAAFIDRLATLAQGIRVGPYTQDPEPFMGPVISDQAAQQLLAAQADLIDRGGRPILQMRSLGARPAMLSPGLIDVTNARDVPDEEIFGPLLQLIRVPDFDAAVRAAKHTRFGLAAGLLSDSREHYERFFRHVRAGVINWNRPTTGASGQLPFGGVGLSGNNRPAGYYAADYCSFPVASLEHPRVTMPEKLPPGLTAP